MHQARLESHYESYRSVFYPPTGKENFVPGEGDTMSGVVLIGEAPGEDEDREARPFVGRSGNLLMKVLKSIGLKRQDIFITNLIKYRPPGNADPKPDDVSAATTLMRWELDILNPRIVVPVGRFACQVWYPNPYMEALSGSRGIKDGRVVIPLFHPSAGLRRAYVRERLFTDIQTLKKERDLCS